MPPAPPLHSLPSIFHHLDSLASASSGSIADHPAPPPASSSLDTIPFVLLPSSPADDAAPQPASPVPPSAPRRVTESPDLPEPPVLYTDVISPPEPFQRHSITSIAPSTSSAATRLTNLSTMKLNPNKSSSQLSLQSQLSGLVPHDSSPASTSALPSQALWLQDLSVELWIDQEGFRAVQPEFVITRYGFADTLSRLPSLTLMAEFSPRQRQSYNFHYSPLDAPPVLRRLTLNGSQSRDYIARQAHLNLKGNGVYVVNGEEDKGTLFWKFEYVVEDRRGRAGKIISGEKAFTPLRFTCSPGILTPEHGKKIKLLHVMKKRVAPKLCASKLELRAGQRHNEEDREEDRCQAHHDKSALLTNRYVGQALDSPKEHRTGHESGDSLTKESQHAQIRTVVGLKPLERVSPSPWENT